jgi:hypothetical protein
MSFFQSRVQGIIAYYYNIRVNLVQIRKELQLTKGNVISAGIAGIQKLWMAILSNLMVQNNKLTMFKVVFHILVTKFRQPMPE